jgi:hypothetical protein
VCGGQQAVVRHARSLIGLELSLARDRRGDGSVVVAEFDHHESQFRIKPQLGIGNRRLVACSAAGGGGGGWTTAAFAWAVSLAVRTAATGSTMRSLDMVELTAKAAPFWHPECVTLRPVRLRLR